MAVGFASYEIARSGMSVNERGLYVTGHNISNVNTPGYVRQQAMIKNGPLQMENGKYQIGLGADIQEIRQIRHTFLDNIYRQENTTLGYWEAKNKTFEDVQAILGEPMGAGLQNVMNQFWDSWQELSKAPDSLTVRALVRQRGEAMIYHINHLGSQLDKLQDDLNSEVRVRIDEINQLTSQIANLNVAILRTEITGDSANDFRDQRNYLVDKLTNLADVQVNEMQDGELDITLGGYFLVTKGVQKNLYAAESKAGGMFYVPKLEGTDIEVTLHGGTLKGLMESRGEVFGATGSYENGTPNAKTDITLVVDNSSGSAGNLDKIKSSILSYVSELKKSGVDYNLRLVTYGSSASMNSTVWTKDNIDTFDDAVTAISEASGDTGNNFGGAGGVIETLGTAGFMQEAGKYAVVFTHESIDGNETDIDNSTLNTYISSLNEMGVKLSVATGNTYINAGDLAAGPLATPAGWAALTTATEGKNYNINTEVADYPNLMISISADIRNSVNKSISMVEPSSNVVSDLRKKLNALVNVMVREVNYLHRSGMTMGKPPSEGQDFFTVINPAYAMEMGNIKLNDNLNDLNNIVASATGENGDNTIALKLANLRHQPLMEDSKSVLSLDGFYQSIILSVGNDGWDAARISENQHKLLQSADGYRQSIMGVSMDEEMTNMMKYKFAYNASSRAINVIDEMMETIITRMGLAGR